MFPVRVLVETVRSQHCIGCAHDGNPLVDTFAVVGGQTMLCQLVETVLAALGLPQLVQDSKGGGGLKKEKILISKLFFILAFWSRKMRK